MRKTSELNHAFHTPEQIRQLFSAIIGKPVDESFALFPPFYTECGRNIFVENTFSSTAAAIFRIRGASISTTGR